VHVAPAMLALLADVCAFRKLRSEDTWVTTSVGVAPPYVAVQSAGRGSVVRVVRPGVDELLCSGARAVTHDLPSG
jgi:hypothetical protein